MNESMEITLLRINSERLSKECGLSVGTICRAYNEFTKGLSIKIWPTYESLRILCKSILVAKRNRSRAITNVALGARGATKKKTREWYSSKVMYKKGK